MNLSGLDSIRRVLYRVLMAGWLTLSASVLWAQTQRQSTQSVIHGIPLSTMLGGAMTLFVISTSYIRSNRKLALAGVTVSLWCFWVGLFPTL